MATLVRAMKRELVVPGPNTNFKKHRFKNGTLYQILLRELVRQKPVEVKPLLSQLRRERPSLSDEAVHHAMKKIEGAARNSGDPILSKLRFVRMPRGGATRVKAKGHVLVIPGPRSYFKTHRFSNKRTLYEMLFRNLLSREPVKVKALHRELKREEPLLAQYTIIFAMKKIERAARNSGDPILSELSFVRMSRGGATSVRVRRSARSRYTEEQLKVLMQTIKKMHSNSKSPTNPQIREKFLAALRKAGLAENVSLSNSTINRAKKKWLPAVKAA